MSNNNSNSNFPQTVLRDALSGLSSDIHAAKTQRDLRDPDIRREAIHKAEEIIEKLMSPELGLDRRQAYYVAYLIMDAHADVRADFLSTVMGDGPTGIMTALRDADNGLRSVMAINFVLDDMRERDGYTPDEVGCRFENRNKIDTSHIDLDQMERAEEDEVEEAKREFKGMVRKIIDRLRGDKKQGDNPESE